MAGNAEIGALRVSLGLDSAQFEDGIKKVKSSLGGIGKAFSVLGGAALFAGFTTGVGQAVGRIEEMRKLSAQLDKALANVGNTAKTSAKEVEQFADKLERSTGRAAEEVMAVATNLATFSFSREVFYDAITLANDMSAAWGGDLKQNVEGLARALADPEKGLAMLTKRGITFTDQQKKMIEGFVKANDLLSAQGVVMDALNEQVKGVAEAGFDGLTKASANAFKSVEDFFEGVANGLRLDDGLTALLTGAAAGISLVTSHLDTIGKVAVVAGAMTLTALGPAIWASMAAAAASFGRIAVAAITAVGVAIRANPIGALITAIVGAVTAVIMFSDQIGKAFGVDLTGMLKGAANAIIGTFVGAFEAIKATWALLPAAIGDLVYQAANSTINGLIYLVREAQSILNGLIGSMQAMFRGTPMEGLFKGKMELAGYVEIPNPFEGAAGAVGAIIDEKFGTAMGTDWLGSLFGDVEATTAPVVKGFDDVTAAIEKTGGAAKGLKDDFGRMGKTALQVQASTAATFANMASQITGTLAGMFEDNKAIAVANAVVSGIEGVAKTLSAYPAPFSFVMAGVQAAAAAAQVVGILNTSTSTKSMPNTVPSSAGGVPDAAQLGGAGTAIHVTYKGNDRASFEQFMRDLQDASRDGFTYVAA